MDKVSPDFSTALVKTKSWTDVECSLGDDKNIDLVEDGSSTPIPTCDGLQIVEAHTVVDVDTSPLEGECANDGSDCFVSEVFTPAVACKQEGINGETALPTSVEAATHPEGTVMPVGIDDTDLQPPAKKRSITAYAEQFMDDEVLADPLPPAAEPPAPPMLFGSFVDPGKGDPNILVSLESAELWHQFYQAGTEMIITKSGRRMFPGIMTSIVGLEPDSKYIVSMEVNPADNHRYKYINGKWVVVGKADSHCEDLLKYVHPDSPATGRHWTSSKVSFKKIKVTNNKNKSNKRGQQVALNSMHRYTPRVVVAKCTSKKNSTIVYTLDLHECSFIAVTAYQNDQVTQLKIDHNPFAKAFRENPGENEMYGYGMMGVWPPISPLLSPYSNGFADPQGMNQGMISPGLAPPGPSPLPHFGAAFGSWESPPYSPTSYRHHPATGLPSPAALSDTHRQMVWNATKPSQDSPPISPLVNGFPAPSMGHGVYSFPHMASSQDGTMKSPLLPGVSLPGVSARHHFIPSSTVGYGPPSYSSTSIIQAPNGNYKVPITPSEQGSAFMVPKLEPNRSPTNSPHM